MHGQHVWSLWQVMDGFRLEEARQGILLLLYPPVKKVFVKINVKPSAGGGLHTQTLPKFCVSRKPNFLIRVRFGQFLGRMLGVTEACSKVG